MSHNDRPAIAGGRPVRTAMLPYGRHGVSEADIERVTAILRSEWLTTGPTIERFERAVADALGAPHVVALSSGTAALHAACVAAGIGPGDEVIVPPLTFVATANAVIFCGGTPVFADIEAETLMLDPVAVRAVLTEQTKAVLVVHYAGASAALPALRAVTGRRGLTVIEDAAHAFGAERDGERVGARSELAAFSFHPVKLFTTGEGGAVATTSADRARRIRSFRNHGFALDVREREARGSWQNEMIDLGYNYRLTDIGAALGMSQLARAAALLARRREIAMRYLEAFRDEPAMRFPKADPAGHAWHIFPALLASGTLRATRDEFVRALRAEGIGANVHYMPVHMHPYYRERYGHALGEFPVAEDASSRLVTLPLFPGMTDHDIEDVVTATRRVLAWFRA